MSTNSNNSSIQVGKKTFITSVLILLALMTISGILTKVVPAGMYSREVIDGTVTIVPNSFTFIESSGLPIYKWYTAPIEVLFSSDSLMIITIILFILIIGATFNILDKSNILKYIMSSIASKFSDRKYVLLTVMSFMFMIFGSTIGIFEEMVPLVPIIIALSFSMGWDSLVGLGISILSVGFGFASAIFNPFTLGVAQEIAGLPVFSGVIFRIFIFIVVYLILLSFLIRYAKKIENNPKLSLVYEEDKAVKGNYSNFEAIEYSDYVKKGAKIFSYSLVFILLTIICTTFIDSLSSYSLPLVAILFLLSGIICSLVSKISYKEIGAYFINGAISIAPGILLILLASSVKHIISTGNIMDTILYYISLFISKQSPFTTAMLIYASVLGLNFFIGSGSAKAFLVMPIVAPLADLVGVNRQIAVQAFCFGDGFSNMIYPTNAVLLLALGLSTVSYTKWFKWTIKLQGFMILLSTVFIWIALKINYGPF